MALSCGARCLKLTIFAFNFVFVMLGILCIAMGVWFIVDKNALYQIADATDELNRIVATSDTASEMQRLQVKELKNWAQRTRILTYVGWAFLFGGCGILTIAFIGCCGAIKSWRPLLAVYAIVLMLLLAFELSIAIYASINQTVLEMQVKKWLNGTLTLYDESSTVQHGKTMKSAWDGIMVTYRCCGVENSADEFTKSAWYRKVRDKQKSRVPPACCSKINEQTFVAVCHETDRHMQGCYDVLRKEVLSQHGVAIGIAASVAVIELFGIMMAIWLCQAISRSVEREYMDQLNEM